MRRSRAAGVRVTGLLVLVTTLVAACGGSQHRSLGGAAVGTAGTPAIGAAVQGDGAVGKAASAASAPAVPLTAAVVRTAAITVRIQRIAAADRVAAIARAAGGDVEEDDRSLGRNPSATIRVAVPPQTLTSVLSELSGLGAEQSRAMSTQDVTAEVADVDSRVASAQQSIARLRLLFAKATRVADIIAIEQELATREADLESLEAQQRALAAQTGMAHVTTHLVTAVPKPVRARTGLVGGLARGWDALRSSLSAGLTGLGIAAPFAAVAALLLGAAVLAVRYRRRRRVPVSDAT